MNQLFTSGHQQLFDTQCSGLSAAWRRAAEESARQPAQAPSAPGGTAHRGAWRVGAVFLAGAMLIAALWIGLNDAATGALARAESDPAAPTAALAQRPA